MSTDKQPQRLVEIIRFGTGEAVESFDVTDYSERQIERLMSGMSINLNHDEFYIQERRND
ncbi:hypothetical protein [Corynebacterium macginleyi]|uniref:hypothetical protein n=1 Tax=Corynebacterium macginleyi TaxID=38290 RepID=UPI00190AD800|nr:hypothetical protein [Corynebacterium macginleyi]MBK4183184.1 hypothetical protein [Corynebacterium macginleyi]